MYVCWFEQLNLPGKKYEIEIDLVYDESQTTAFKKKYMYVHTCKIAVKNIIFVKYGPKNKSSFSGGIYKLVMRVQALQSFYTIVNSRHPPLFKADLAESRGNALIIAKIYQSKRKKWKKAIRKISLWGIWMMVSVWLMFFLQDECFLLSPATIKNPLAQIKIQIIISKHSLVFFGFMALLHKTLYKLMFSYTLQPFFNITFFYIIFGFCPRWSLVYILILVVG